MNTTELFFSLLRSAIGREEVISNPITAKEWEEVFELAKQQALVGITFLAVEKLSPDCRPPRELLLKWWSLTEQIKRRSQHLNETVLLVERQFAKDGLRGTILKGVGIAALYPEPLYRTPGDIDIWLDAERDEIVTYVRKHKEKPFVIYHHVDFVEVNGVSIEVHFTPSYFSDFQTNNRFQQYVREQRPLQMEHVTMLEGVGEVHTPTLAFNRVYVLSHIYRHLFDEGVGLRQLLDYYYVLRQGFTEEEREETVGVLCRLKMKRFAASVMWVLKEVFGMEERYMLVAPNEKEGRFLLDEIMIAGNFGHHDPRIIRSKDERLFIRFVRRTVRNLRFLRSYPSEVIGSPIFKIWQRIWMLKYN